ncbi:hypothetical protein PV797_07150 [Clostridiaceae bacterium M8S5]|nr:hypothetical protein PV797_07150 [Clostridiaceae bacterium M8S5]
MRIGYYAILNYDDEYDKKEQKYGISIYFHDIPECISCARSEEEGIKMAEEVLKLCTIDMQVYKLPKVTALDDLQLKDNEKAYFITYNTEDLDMSKFAFYN